MLGISRIRNHKIYDLKYMMLRFKQSLKMLLILTSTLINTIKHSKYNIVLKPKKQQEAIQAKSEGRDYSNLKGLRYRTQVQEGGANYYIKVY